MRCAGECAAAARITDNGSGWDGLLFQGNESLALALQALVELLRIHGVRKSLRDEQGQGTDRVQGCSGP